MPLPVDSNIGEWRPDDDIQTFARIARWARPRSTAAKRPACRTTFRVVPIVRTDRLVSDLRHGVPAYRNTNGPCAVASKRVGSNLASLIARIPSAMINILFASRYSSLARQKKHSRHYVKCTCESQVPIKPCLFYHMSEWPKL